MTDGLVVLIAWLEWLVGVAVLVWFVVRARR